MPPRKRRTNDVQSVQQKRSKGTRAVTVAGSSPPSGGDVAPSAIDYDRLASAILRQTRGAPDLQMAGVIQPDTPGPSTQGACTRAQEETSMGFEPPAPPQELGEQPPPTTTGLGSLLDTIFLGEPARSHTQGEQDLLEDGIPLGTTVSHKIKTKIWSDEFIDLRSLLSFREDPLSVTISTGVINLHQDPKFKAPISIAQWTDAFLIFSAIYLQKFPDQAPHLLKYCHTIRELHRLHGDTAFRTYDEQFRKLKESRNVPWQKPIAELRLRALTMSKSLPAKTQNQPFRARFCFQFNKGERCTRNPCQFKHSCMQCRANHPISKCPDLARAQGPSRPANANQGR